MDDITPIVTVTVATLDEKFRLVCYKALGLLEKALENNEPVGLITALSQAVTACDSYSEDNY